MSDTKHHETVRVSLQLPWSSYIYVYNMHIYIYRPFSLSLFNSSIHEPLWVVFRGGGAANHLWMMRPHKAMCLVPLPPHPPGNAHAASPRLPTTTSNDPWTFVTWYVSFWFFWFSFPFLISSFGCTWLAYTCRWKGLELPNVWVGVNLVPFSCSPTSSEWIYIINLVLH